MAVSKQDLANAIRFLSIDAVEKANSGHPGMPQGMADIAEVLWNDHLNHNPNNPAWANRDRFVLSNGHGCMLLYSLLHLSGYKVSIDDIKNFRQLNSKTPGHPEAGELPGVETTTGPLGQGVANAVGMAIAEANLGSEFNKPDVEIVNHFTYCFVGDGCLMEGVSHEVCSLAGTLGLGKLIVVWDDNNISIDGDVKDWFSENTADRFKSYNWHVIENVDGHNPAAISQAFIDAKANTKQPTLICAKTTIGYGSPNKAGTAKSHGSPLGFDEVSRTRKNLNWPYKEFEIPESIYATWDAKEKGTLLESKWQDNLEAYKSKYPLNAAEFERRINNKLPDDWEDNFNKALENIINNPQDIASRKASQNALNILAKDIPELLGGSADLSCSNLTNNESSRPLAPNNLKGNYINYGVREFGMAAIMNGLSLYSGYIPYGGTFLVFADYAKNAMRLSCLSNQQVIYVLTHDSIGLGEDGPTHQPVEHLTMLRTMPRMSVWRPADELETFVAWRESIKHQNGPTSLALSRQKLPALRVNKEKIDDIAKGAYILKTADKINLNIIATGSEVSIAIQVAKDLEQNNSDLKIQVVSMPNTNVFDKQEDGYKNKIIPNNIPSIAIEAGHKDFWHKYVGRDGLIFGLTDFGKSAPYQEVYKDFGLDKDSITNKILTWLKK